MNQLSSRIAKLEERISEMNTKVENSCSLLKELIQLLGPSFPRHATNDSNIEILQSSEKGTYIDAFFIVLVYS
jgi:hypothetical protein